MRSYHCISCPEIPLASGNEQSSPADICSSEAIRILFACTHCLGDLSWQFGPKMKSSSLCPSPFFYIFSCRTELLEIWLGWGWASSLVLVLCWPGTESCGGSWHCGKAAATAWECKWQVAVLMSVSPGHPSSEPTGTPIKAFAPFQVRRHCEE